MALLTSDEREIYETSLVENSLFNRDNVGAKATKCYAVGLKMLNIFLVMIEYDRQVQISPSIATPKRFRRFQIDIAGILYQQG